jgi:predicted nucleic acid-binding protein
MRKRAYIDTTVVSYLTARPSRDLIIAAHQESTRNLWTNLIDKYDTFVSALVYQEAASGNSGQAKLRLEAIQQFRMLDVDDESKELAEMIIAGKGIPREYPEDALHIALAAVNGMDIIVTWNFAHMNNPFTKRSVRKIVEQAGYACPELCSPDELLEAVK